MEMDGRGSERRGKESISMLSVESFDHELPQKFHPK